MTKPAQYTVKKYTVYEDGSAISVLLEFGGKRVAGNFVAGNWKYHVVQNKQRTVKITKSEQATIEYFCQKALDSVSPEWIAAHNAMYAN